jgi:acyl carrier protein
VFRETYTAPRTPTETEIAAIWAEVLKKPEIGIHDNFFEQGGHSLASVEVFTLIRKRLKQNLRVADLFVAPTIAGLAARVDRMAPQGPIQPGSPSAQPTGSQPDGPRGNSDDDPRSISSRSKGDVRRLFSWGRRGRET